MKILQVDHQVLFREGMRHLLRELDDALELLATSSLSEALSLLAGQADIDLVLLDIATPGMGGCEGLRALHRAYPDVPLVALAGSERAGDIHEAMRAGAAAYVPKTSTSRVMLNALRLVLEGGTCAPRRRLSGDEEALGLARLTRRQLEVLALMAEGLPNKSIARRLFLSEATVKGHVTAILSTFGVDNRLQAVNKARQGGGFGQFPA